LVKGLLFFVDILLVNLKQWLAGSQTNAKNLEGTVYKTMIRPVLMYGAEAWTRRERKGYRREQKSERCGGYMESH